MKKPASTLAVITILFFSCTSSTDKTGSSDSAAIATGTTTNNPLPSWNDGDVKKGLIDYVTTATKEGSSGFIPTGDRIAVFDNDGTVWSEQPLYFQFFYSFDKIKQMAPQHPEWKTKEPFKSVYWKYRK
jgi:hypothetical protein